MPGCAAFEMVTPPYVGGGLVGGTIKSDLPPMTPDGDHVLGLAFDGFAGTGNLEQEGFEYGAIYEFSRTSGGWSTEALDPPAESYPRRQFVFASADLSSSLWKVQEPVQSGHELPPVPPNGVDAENNFTLVLREAAGGGKGRFTVVGPVTAPGHEPAVNGVPVRGASSNLSHILLDVAATKKQLWPGDQTLANDQSLYEYVGTGGGEPVLVGVSNEGSLAEAAAREGKAHINEAAQLISRCGTVAGGKPSEFELEQGVVNNAMSASGSVVFFTALECAGGPVVNELYARVNGSETVDISEPSPGPGGDCASCEELERLPAVFAGASEDGSKVFFYSQQELLPGAAGENLYEYNFHAVNPHERLTLVAPAVERVAAISGDGSHVYFDSKAVLGASENGNGETAQHGAQNLYVYNTDAEAGGEPVFVAQEAGRQYVTAHGKFAEEIPGVDTTRDGRFAVFGSPRHIAGTDDSSGVPQIFEYDADTGVITRVSVGAEVPSECAATHVVEARYGCDGNTASEEYDPELAPTDQDQLGQSYAPTLSQSGLSLAADGTVLFQSRDALTPFAALGGRNVYEYRSGEVFLISPGNETVPYEREPGETRLLGISETDGNDETEGNIFFSTSSQLVPQDTDTQEGWYDAREDGGFPAPTIQPACIGEACQGATSTPPTLMTAGASKTTLGGANLTPASNSAPSPSKPSLSAQLSKALRACRKDKRKSKRVSCEKQARKHYASTRAG
jgi:hypothetical protein